MWATHQGGEYMSFSENKLHRISVCAKHQNARGVFVHRRDEVRQVTRVLIS
jgi:hypothetical protein